MEKETFTRGSHRPGPSSSLRLALRRSILSGSVEKIRILIFINYSSGKVKIFALEGVNIGGCQGGLRGSGRVSEKVRRVSEKVKKGV